MLIRTNNMNRNGGIFICNVCRQRIINSERKTIYVSTGGKNLKKKWDLCKECYEIFRIGIEKNTRRIKNGKKCE